MDATRLLRYARVGGGADSGPDIFHGGAAALLGAGGATAATGSQAYWRLLGLMEQRQGAIPIEGLIRLQELELRAVVQAELYEDVRPSLEELKALGVSAYLASSLSRPAGAHFLERLARADLCVGRLTR